METAKPNSKPRFFTWQGVAALLVVLLLVVGVLTPGDGALRAAHVAATRNKMEQIQTATKNYNIEFGTFPAANDNATLIRTLEGGNPRGIAFLSLKYSDKNSKGDILDAWGTPFQINVGADGKIHVRSAGPDKIFGTADDITNQ